MCGHHNVQMAHLVPRASDKRKSKSLAYVNPSNIVPLCQGHHMAFDAHRLNLLPYLNLDEQAYVVGEVGIMRALKRLEGAS